MVLDDLVHGNNLIFEVVFMLKVWFVQNSPQDFGVNLISNCGPTPYYLAICRLKPDFAKMSKKVTLYVPSTRTCTKIRELPVSFCRRSTISTVVRILAVCRTLDHGDSQV